MTEIVYITRVILSSQSHSHVIYVTPKARLMFVQNAGRPLKFIMAASMTWDAKHLSCNCWMIQEEKQARNAHRSIATQLLTARTCSRRSLDAMGSSDLGETWREDSTPVTARCRQPHASCSLHPTHPSPGPACRAWPCTLSSSAFHARTADPRSTPAQHMTHLSLHVRNCSRPHA